MRQKGNTRRSYCFTYVQPRQWLSTERVLTEWIVPTNQKVSQDGTKENKRFSSAILAKLW